MQEFRLGCAVWSYRGWLGGFYPAGSVARDFLRLYGDRLHAVEGNTTFYSVPSIDTVARWREQTPAEFRFCLKFPRTVTHEGLLTPKLSEAKAFIERVKPLGDRLSCIFAQLPPHYSPGQLADLENFLQTLAPCQIPLGVEVRHPHWFTEPHRSNLDNLLSQHSITKILLDTRPIYNCSDNPQAQSKRRKPNLPVYPSITSHQAIVRFISHPNPEYNQKYLQEWLTQIQQWWATGKSIHFFVHCPIEDHSPHNAKLFQAQLEAAKIPIPKLPWQNLAPEPQQLSLF